jgi:hypothetical protein
METMGYEDHETEAVIGQIANLLRRGPGGGQQMQRFGQQGQRGGYGRGMQGMPGGPQQIGRNNVWTRPPLPAYPEHPSAMLRSFVGMGFTTWTGTDDADKVMQIEPQEKFRGERMVIDVLATAGAAGLVMVRLLQVGVQPQQPDTSEPAPASMFAADVTYSHLDLQIAKPGIKLTLTLTITAAPGTGETVTASAGFYGEWIR